MSQIYKRLFKRNTKHPRTVATQPAPAILTQNFEPAPILDANGANLGLKVVYEPRMPTSPNIDIVFVHGLTGSSYHTWRHTGTGIYWPSDLLYNEIPQARVAVFGYDADIVGFWNPASNNRISNHAQNLLGALARLRDRTTTESRKIIYVAHSLGGLIVEEALRVSRAHAEQHMRQIETLSLGIVFLGTPQHGADMAAWVSFGQKIAKIGKSSNKDIIFVLRPGSEVLAIVQNGFHSILRLKREENAEFFVTCFYEELPLPVVGEVVSKDSAIIPGYSHFGIHANHMDMTKFNNSDNEGFQAISGEIRRWIKNSRATAPALSLSVEDQEFLRSLDFEDSRYRQHDIETAHSQTFHWVWKRPDSKLQSFLRSNDSMFWVTGKPGSGKSTMMKYLAESLPSEAKTLSKAYIPVVASYFVGFDRSAVARSITGILRSLLRQILKARPELIACISNRFHDKKDTEANFIWTLADLEYCFGVIYQQASSGRIILLIDALDEYAGEDDHVSEYFLDMARRYHGKVKMCVSSRQHAAFNHEFADCPSLIMQHETQADIEEYVSSKLALLGRDIEGSSVHVTQVSEEIVNKASGVFLWIKLVCDELIKAGRRGEDFTHLKARLRSLQQGLNSLYQRMLDDVADADRLEAMTMLAMVNTAYEPMSPLDLRYALHCSLGIYDDESGLYSDSLANGRIMALTGGLLDIRTSEDDSTVHLAHHTVKMFLDSISSQPNTSTTRDLRILNSHEPLLKACVKRLVAFSNFSINFQHLVWEGLIVKWTVKNQFGHEVIIEDIAHQPLAAYSVGNLVEHAKYLEMHTGDASPALISENIPFMVFGLVGKYMEVKPPAWVRTIAHGACPKSMMEFFVLVDLQQHFYSLWSSTGAQHRDIGRLLYAVAYSGNMGIARMILEHCDALRSETSPYARSALTRAIYHGNLGVARLLLQHGADPNLSGFSDDAKDMFPIEAAMHHSSHEAVSLLGEYKANFDCYIPIFGSALQAAARRGNLQLLQILLDNGANASATVTGSIYSSALEAALFTTNRDLEGAILERLLAAGAPLTTLSSEGRSVSLFDKAIDASDAVAVETFLTAGKTKPRCLCRALLAQSASSDPNSARIVRLLVLHGIGIEDECVTHLGLEELPDVTNWSEDMNMNILEQIRGRLDRREFERDTLETTSTSEGRSTTTSRRVQSPYIPTNLPNVDLSRASYTSMEAVTPENLGLFAPIPVSNRPDNAPSPLFRISSPGGIPPSRPRML